jgi:hypothetical protein
MELNFNEAYEVLRAETSTLGGDSAALATFWADAKVTLAKVTDAEGWSDWQRWVRWASAEARAPGVRRPLAIFGLRLRDSRPSKKKVRQRPGRSRPEDEKAYMKAARDARENPSPSVPWSPVVALVRRGRSFREGLELVQAEWERQGQPWPKDFDADAL